MAEAKRKARGERRTGLVSSKVAVALAIVVAPCSAWAQGTMNAERPPATQWTTEEPAPGVEPVTPSSSAVQPSAEAPTTTATPDPATASSAAPISPAPPPPVVAPPPVPAVQTEGQWVYTETYGWIWVPQGSSAVIVQERPYVYLYTPVYGWTWYGSPWGYGGYYAGPWVHAAWGPMRVWHRGGWYAPPPRVVARPRVVAPPVYRGGGAVIGGGHGGGRRGGRR
jgi:hypothetical protein